MPSDASLAGLFKALVGVRRLVPAWAASRIWLHGHCSISAAGGVCTGVQVLQVVLHAALCSPSLVAVAEAGLHWSASAAGRNPKEPAALLSECLLSECCWLLSVACPCPLQGRSLGANGQKPPVGQRRPVRQQGRNNMQVSLW